MTHPFELSGLGRAPFRFIGVEKKTYQACPGAPIQPGAACDHCSTGIMFLFWCESADGRRFKVGSDCILKLCRKDDPLAKRARREVAARQKEAEAARITSALVRFNDDPHLLANVPHPKGWAGRTARDYVKWMVANAGHTGKLRAARLIEQAPPPAPPKPVQGPPPPPAAPPAVLDFAALDSFIRAGKAKRWPSRVASAGNGERCKLSIAGPAARFPGSINVTSDASYHDSVWYGRIHTDGRFEPARRCPDEVASYLARTFPS